MQNQVTSFTVLSKENSTEQELINIFKKKKTIYVMEKNQGRYNL